MCVPASCIGMDASERSYLSLFQMTKRHSMTLSQRLTRAGLTFILLGTVAAALPQQSGAAQADTAQCGTTGSVYYRLTADSSGASDTAHATPVPAGTSEDFFFFQSTTGVSGTYAAFTPTSFTPSGYTTVINSGNHYQGKTNSGSNTLTAVVSGTPSFSISDGTVISP